LDTGDGTMDYTVLQTDDIIAVQNTTSSPINITLPLILNKILKI